MMKIFTKLEKFIDDQQKANEKKEENMGVKKLSFLDKNVEVQRQDQTNQD